MRTRKRAAALLLIATACAESGKAPSTTRPEGLRVVSLHDVTTELVVALAAERSLVGMAEPVDTTPEVRHALTRVPRVASLESILAVKPDVVLGLGVVAEREPELVERLRERGVEVHLADLATLDDIYSLARAVAQRSGSATAGEQLVKSLRARVERAAPQGANSEPKRVFVYDCCDPPFTAGGRTVLSDLIARAGGHNVFADVAADWTHVSWEEALARRPDLVVIHAYDYKGQGDVADKRRLLARTALAELPTVVMPLGYSLGGLRSVDGLVRLREAMTPP